MHHPYVLCGAQDALLLDCSEPLVVILRSFFRTILIRSSFFKANKLKAPLKRCAIFSNVDMEGEVLLVST
jgi:hypothetical protein